MSLLPSTITSALTPEEADFIYNLEVLGLPTKKAASLSGVVVSLVYAPHIKQARELVRSEIDGDGAYTRRDIVAGMRGAVDRARILGEPMTEIVGWKEIARLTGNDLPTKIDINVTSTVEAMRDVMRSIPDSELSKLVGADNVIDAEFYRIEHVEPTQE